MTDQPVGMVDELDALSPAPERSAAQAAMIRWVVTPGGVDAAELAAAGVPEAMQKAGEEGVARRATDWPWLAKYRAMNRAAVRPRVVFIGDSITEFWAENDPDLFSGPIVGRGISGQTSPQVLLRFYPDVVALKPATVHIMVGINDIAGNTGPSTPGDFQNNILAMLDISAANRIQVLLASILPAAHMPWVPQILPAPRIAELNLWLEQTAALRGAIYVDYHSALADEAGGFRAGLANDGLHPNSAGYAIMRPIAMATIGRLSGA